MSELKPLPCPFCGGAPRTVARPDNIDGTRFFYALACYCGGYSACAHKMAVEPTPEQAKRTAIEAWNRRAQPAQAGQVLTDADWPDVDDMAHSAVQEALAFGLNHDVFCRYGRAVLAKAQIAAEQAVLAKRVPMTDEQIEAIGVEYVLGCCSSDLRIAVRETERHHGIGGEKGGA